MAVSKNLDAVYFSKYLYADSTSPSGLRWAVQRAANAKKDSPAGCKNARGYWQVRLEGVTYYVHRVIWTLTHGDPGDLVINHRDNNPSNNSISNLEVCTAVENQRRQKMHTGNGLNSSNSSGITGVREHLSSNGTYQAQAQWYDKATGKQKNKTFSYAKYGILEAWAMACQCRKEQEKE